MGEWSKKLGEIGEDITGKLLDLIGWSNAQGRQDIICRHGGKHKLESSQGDRQKHGIDRLFSYESPLIDQTLQNLIISVKYSDDAYAEKPDRTARKHLRDLAFAVECYKRSELRYAAIASRRGLRSTEDCGVLFWLTNDATQEQSILPKLAEVSLGDIQADPLYVVDNHQASFLFDSLTYLRREHTTRELSFFYQQTGQNMIQSTRRTHGEILPVQQVNSPILTLRSYDKKTGAKSLIACAHEPFSEESFRQLCGLSQTLSQGWATQVDIGFSEYDMARDDNAIARVKGLFTEQDFTATIKLFCYRPEFRLTLK